MRCCDANDVDGDKYTNSEQLETTSIADGDYSLVSNATIVPYVAEPTVVINACKIVLKSRILLVQFPMTNLLKLATSRDNTYAEVASHQPPLLKRVNAWLPLKIHRLIMNYLPI